MNIFGHDVALASIAAAARSDRLHHGWLLHGPKGVGKASFASVVARLLLDGTAADSRSAKLLDADTHPDLLTLAPLIDEKTAKVARSIKVDQVRWLRERVAQSTALGGRRVVIIDSVDELEGRGGPNALLKMLEEPPAGTVFLLVSHAPGRLLPTIRSRCRALALGRLDDDAMAAFLDKRARHLDDVSRAILLRLANGSPGDALRVIDADVSGLDAAFRELAATGDGDLRQRLQLGEQLALKSAVPRYDAFLKRAPAFIASAARVRSGNALSLAIAAWERARTLADVAIGQSLPAEDVVIEIAGLIASLADEKTRAKA